MSISTILKVGLLAPEERNVYRLSLLRVSGSVRCQIYSPHGAAESL